MEKNIKIIIIIIRIKKGNKIINSKYTLTSKRIRIS